MFFKNVNIFPFYDRSSVGPFQTLEIKAAALLPLGVFIRQRMAIKTFFAGICCFQGLGPLQLAFNIAYQVTVGI